MNRFIPLWLCVFLVWTGAACAESLIRPEDRIVFIGDSITGQGGNGKHNGWVGMIGIALKETDPAHRQTLVALGGSGQTVGGWVNVERKSRTASTFLDVKAFDVQAELNQHADVVVIMLGMNDVLAPRQKDDEESYRKWIEEYRTLISALRERTTPRLIALATPTPCTEDPASPKNAVMDTMIVQLAKLAAEEKCTLLPTRDTTWEVHAMGRRLKPDFHFTSDQVHPGGAGHLAIAAGMLRGLGEPKAADLLLKRAEADVRKSLGASALSYEVSLPIYTKPGDALQFEIRAYHGGGRAELTTPEGWAIRETRVGRDETIFVVAAPNEYPLISRLTLKSGSDTRGIAIPAPWLVGTGNLGWKGWVSGVFNPEIGRLSSDESVRTGKNFTHAMNVIELTPTKLVGWKPYVGGVNYGGGGAPGAVDFAAVTYFMGGEVGYGLRWIHSDRERPVKIKAGRTGFAGVSHLELWLNGSSVYMGDPLKAKGREFPVRLNAGWNLLSFKSNFQQWQWQFSIDMEAVEGDTLEALRYSIVPR